MSLHWSKSLYGVTPVSGREVGRIFRSSGSRRDRGPKWSSGEVREDKI